jgi:hypothetical protein
MNINLYFKEVQSDIWPDIGYKKRPDYPAGRISGASLPMILKVLKGLKSIPVRYLERERTYGNLLLYHIPVPVVKILNLLTVLFWWFLWRVKSNSRSGPDRKHGVTDLMHTIPASLPVLVLFVPAPVMHLVINNPLNRIWLTFMVSSTRILN